MVIAVVELFMAVLMFAGQHLLSNLLLLVCVLGTFASAMIAMRDASQRMLMVVQSAVAASILALFWAGGTNTHAGSSVSFGGSTYDLTLTLTALQFTAILFARLLRRAPEAAACNCGH